MEDLIYKFLKFGVVGITGMSIDFSITWLIRDKLRLNQYVANSAGFICAVVSNYILNRIWTFHSTDPSVAVQFGKFLFVSLVGLGLNNGIIYLLNGKYRTPFYIAKVFATGVVMIWNFWANLSFTFRK